MRISLYEDARPFSVYNPRTIPIGYHKHVKQHLEELLRRDIIEEVTHPTE